MPGDKFVGTVASFDARRGWGFIHRHTGEDYFVHYSNIISDSDYKALSVGQKVLFFPKNGKKGLQAVEVEVLEEAISHHLLDQI